MKKYTVVFGILLMLVGCEKPNLDALAFPSKKLDHYAFEEYNAGKESVPDDYAVEASNRTLISMNSVDQLTGASYKIYGVYIGDLSTIESDTVIMYCHGQAAHMDFYWPRATLLANLISTHHYGVFMMDYRGYGMSEGTATEQGLNEDVDASINWFISQGVEQTKTIYYGFSLGCIPIINRTAERNDFKPSKIILEAPLASVENLIHSSLLINVDPKFLSTLTFNNAEKIKEVDVPLLWLHGKEDDYIAIENGALIYANYNGDFKQAIRVPGGNHGDIPAVMGYENYLKELEKFIRQ